MGDDPTERTTRSGRRTSTGTGTKRKRAADTVEDQANDCNRNKKRMGGDEDETIANQLAEMRAFLGKKIDDGQRATDISISKLSDKIKATDADLNLHKAKTETELQLIRENLGTLTGLQNTSRSMRGSTHASAASASTSASSLAISTRRSNDLRLYWFARRCARFWTIEGTTDSQRWASVQAFMFDKLRIPRGEIKESDLVDIRPTKSARGKPNRGEVIVVFVDVDTRDRVTSYARNLGYFVGADGKPTAGVRHEIPSFLGGVHRALMQYGYSMLKKYRFSKEFKRNIRFEDSEHTFVIDMKLPGSDKWVTVSYDHALEDRKSANRDRERQQGEMLSSRIENEELDELPRLPRMSTSSNASTSSAAVPSSAASSASPTDMDSEIWGSQKK